MNDPTLVCHLHGARQGFDELRGRFGVGRAPGDPLLEASAVNEFQREERPAFVLAGLVDLHDIGVCQLGDRLGLGAKPGQPHGSHVGPGQDHLERDQSLQPTVAGLVDNPHSASPELGQDVIAGNPHILEGGRDLERPFSGVARPGHHDGILEPLLGGAIVRQKVVRQGGIARLLAIRFQGRVREREIVLAFASFQGRPLVHRLADIEGGMTFVGLPGHLHDIDTRLVVNRLPEIEGLFASVGLRVRPHGQLDCRLRATGIRRFIAAVRQSWRRACRPNIEIGKRVLEVGVGFKSGRSDSTALALCEMRTKRLRLDLESSRLTHEHPEVHRMRTRRCRTHRVGFRTAFRWEPSDRGFRLGTGRVADFQIGAIRITGE